MRANRRICNNASCSCFRHPSVWRDTNNSSISHTILRNSCTTKHNKPRCIKHKKKGTKGKANQEDTNAYRCLFRLVFDLLSVQSLTTNASAASLHTASQLLYANCALPTGARHARYFVPVNTIITRKLSRLMRLRLSKRKRMPPFDLCRFREKLGISAL